MSDASSGSGCPARSLCSPVLWPARRACRIPKVDWRLAGGGPWFDNQVAMLIADGRALEMRLERAVPVDETSARLECVLERRLAG